VFNRIFIYNKGEDDLELPSDVKSCIVIKLPNVGKCDHTYLYHIVTRYYDLATSTVFLAGVCDQKEKWFNALVTVLLASSTFSSAFVTHEIKPSVKEAFFMMHMDTYESKDPTNREKMGVASLAPSVFRPFGLWYQHTFGNTDINHVAYFGIFAAAQQHIHHRDAEFYINLLTQLNKHPNPEVGHYMERAWLAVFHPIPPTCICPLPGGKFFVVQNDDPNINYQSLETIMRGGQLPWLSSTASNQ
jgi:hypothetical protein